MKLITIGLALSLVFVNAAQASHNLPEVDVVSVDNQRWHFRQLTVNQTDTELTIAGQVDAHLRYGLPHGHVDIAAWSTETHKLIAETTAVYLPRLLTKRASRKGGVRFFAKLPILPADARIKIAFHRDESLQPQHPVHDQTIAR